jgi:hypothetical protein
MMKTVGRDCGVWATVVEGAMRITRAITNAAAKTLRSSVLGDVVLFILLVNAYLLRRLQ